MRVLVKESWGTLIVPDISEYNRILFGEIYKIPKTEKILY